MAKRKAKRKAKKEGQPHPEACDCAPCMNAALEEELAVVDRLTDAELRRQYGGRVPRHVTEAHRWNLRRIAERALWQAIVDPLRRYWEARSKGKKGGKVLWHREVLAVANADRTAPLLSLWGQFRDIADPEGIITAVPSGPHRDECKFVVGRPCSQGDHLHWRKPTPDDGDDDGDEDKRARPQHPLHSVTQGTVFKHISTHSPRRPR
jgi:hypothetical protein